MTISRRGALAGAALLPLAARAQAPAPVPGVDANEGWTLERFNAANSAARRNAANMSPATFTAIQRRRDAAITRVERYLASRFQQADAATLRAFRTVPREFFHYDYAGGAGSPAAAYETDPKPWGIGFGSALSDYLGQMYMTQIAQVQPDHVTLEIGTGSGYQTAILSRMVRKAYSIEIIDPLGRGVQPVYGALGYDNVETRVGDGFFGWPEVEGGFDMIIVTCAAQYAPPALFQQLKPGGRLVIPIGQPFRRGQFLYIYSKDAEGRITSRKDVGVYFIPMTGRMMQAPPPPGSQPRT